MSRTLRGVLALFLSATWIGAAASPAAAGGGCHAQRLTDEATNEVTVAENCFTPAAARVAEGESVTWFSGEYEAPHTVTGVAGGFGSDDLPADGQVSTTFNEPGVYPYTCLLHPGMAGAIVVGDAAAAEQAAAPPAGSPPPPTGAAGPGLPAAAAGAVIAGGAVLLAGGALVGRRLLAGSPQ